MEADHSNPAPSTQDPVVQDAVVHAGADANAAQDTGAAAPPARVKRVIKLPRQATKRYTKTLKDQLREAKEARKAALARLRGQREPARLGADDESKQESVPNSRLVSDKVKEQFDTTVAHPASFLDVAKKFKTAIELAVNAYPTFIDLLALGHQMALRLWVQNDPKSGDTDHNDAQVSAPNLADVMKRAKDKLDEAIQQSFKFVCISYNFECVFMNNSIEGTDVQMLMGFSMHAAKYLLAKIGTVKWEL